MSVLQVPLSVTLGIRASDDGAAYKVPDYFSVPSR